MALIRCPECGKELSDKATACPNCGCPIQSIGAQQPILYFKGINGIAVLYRNRIELQRSGINIGNSVITLDHLSNIYINNGTILNAGYIQFLTPGQTNSKNFNSALKAENALLFRHKDKNAANDFRNKVYEFKR